MNKLSSPRARTAFALIGAVIGMVAVGRKCSRFAERTADRSAASPGPTPADLAAARARAEVELRAHEQRKFAGDTPDAVLSLFRARYQASRPLPSEGCALWGAIDAIERGAISSPDLQKALVERLGPAIDALADPAAETKEWHAQGLGFVRSQAVLGAAEFRCQDPEAEFGELEGEARAMLASVRSGGRAEHLPGAGDVAREPRERTFFHKTLETRLRLSLKNNAALRRLLFAEQREKAPYVLRCVTRYLGKGAVEERFAAGANSYLNTPDDVPSRVARLASKRLIGPDRPPADRRKYIDIAPDRAPPARFATCTNVINTGLAQAAKPQAAPYEELSREMIHTGAGQETWVDLRLTRVGAPPSGQLLLAMQVQFGDKERVAVFKFTPDKFARFSPRVTVVDTEEVEWVEGKGGDPDTSDPKDSEIVQGVEVACSAAPPEEYADADAWQCP